MVENHVLPLLADPALPCSVCENEIEKMSQQWYPRYRTQKNIHFPIVLNMIFK